MNSIERHLFFEGLLIRYGYDFRQYTIASMDRRLNALLSRFQTESLLDVLKYVLQSPEAFREILPQLTINTTEFFRDPSFFRVLRESVFPFLKTYPKISIWIAGCSTGEEVLSLAMALKEENLYERTLIHATDINATSLKKAKEGIYDLSLIQSFNKNYTLAGGTTSPSDYYTPMYGLVRFDPKLLENVVFSEHNLVTDAGFIEAHLIICRNVLIYFNRDLQNRVLQLFAESLIYRGFLGLGSKESLSFSEVAPYFEDISETENLFGLKSRIVSQINEPLYKREVILAKN